MMKGAPEIVLTKCSHFLHNKQEKEIDGTFRTDMQAAYERCGFMGERVIGFAYKRVRLRAARALTLRAACKASVYVLLTPSMRPCLPQLECSQRHWPD
jgi:magnesium-transporting ATPase (P-type)